MFILDSHCDTPSQIFRLRDLRQDNAYAHVDLPKLRRGGVDGAFFALYVPASYDDNPDEGFEYAQVLLRGVERCVNENNDQVAFASSFSQGLINKEKGRFSVFLGLENGSPIGQSIDRLNSLYDKGIRYITLCHSKNNHICDSCATTHKRWGGLSSFGRELVAEMNRLGMLIDVSHASDDTFYDVLKHSSSPVVATHSCCRALCDHPRNMSDEMIRDLAAEGGVIQINFYPLFLDAEFSNVLLSSGIVERGELIEKEFIADPANNVKREAWNRIQGELQSLVRPSFKKIADHIDHVVDLVGISHVGIGSDFDGIEVTPSGLEDVSTLPVLFEELKLRGYSDSDIEKIAGLNFFRILG